MKNKRGRPPIQVVDIKSRYLQVRINQAEKAGFDNAAELAGLPLSTWVRERLRKIAVQELRDHGQPIPFLKSFVDN